jgi:hypothetical protein
VTKPNERQLCAMQAIQADDQGQSGDLDIFDARECEAFDWVTKVDGAYRLTEEGTRQLDGMTPKPAQAESSRTVQATIVRDEPGTTS